MNSGFADRRVRPLRHVAGSGVVSPVEVLVGCPSRIRTSANGSKVRCPTTRRRGSGSGSRTRCGGKWSGRRDSNPRPSPWQGDALPTEPLPLDKAGHLGGAESQIRTGDTAIFSRVLYQLSYLGPVPGPPKRARRRGAEYHGPRTSDKASHARRSVRAHAATALATGSAGTIRAAARAARTGSPSRRRWPTPGRGRWWGPRSAAAPGGRAAG
jgi:hypothetical protein